MTDPEYWWPDNEPMKALVAWAFDDAPLIWYEHRVCNGITFAWRREQKPPTPPAETTPAEDGATGETG